MSRALVIFDGDCDPAGCLPASTPVDLLPLTGDWRVIRTVTAACERAGNAVRVLEAARLFDREVQQIREQVAGWSARLGERRVGGRTMKEWCRGSRPVSGWWFSILAEKNNLKTDAFFRVAQIAAVDRLLGGGSYAACVVSTRESSLRRALGSMSRRHRVAGRDLPSAGRAVRKNRRRGRAWLAFGGLAELAHAVARLAKFCREAVDAKRTLGDVRKRRRHPSALLFVSYYPAIDEQAAKGGVFVNRYAGPLQTARPINWVLMYLPRDGWTYRQAVDLARTFIAHQEPVFLRQEFLSPGVVARAVRAWLHQCTVYVRLTRRAGKDFLTEGFAAPEAREFLFPLWRQSFLGWTGLSGWLDYELFRKVFAFFPDAKHCLYYAEMHAWEQALNAARNTTAPGVRTIAFQHATVSRNHFFYLRSPEETRRTGAPADLPLPDVMACNGAEAAHRFACHGYQDVRQVEAVRHLYLARAGRERGAPALPPIVLVAGSYDSTETASLILLTQEAFPQPEPLRIWFKPHPAQDWHGMCRELKLSPEIPGWTVKEDPIETLLPEVSVVIGGESGVSLEALAYGCRVVAPVLNDAMFMNPLDGHEEFYDRVHGPDELRGTVEDILKGRPAWRPPAETDALVATMWNLEESLPRWQALLG